MKKLLFFVTAVFFVANAANAQGGRLRISIADFTCNAEGDDGLIQTDGHGTEIFISYAYRIFNPANINAVQKGQKETRIYGCCGAQRNRIQAGSKSAIGGITSGDVIAVAENAIDITFNDGDILLFSPSIWEWDETGNEAYQSFKQQLATDLDWAVTQNYSGIDFSGYTNERGQHLVFDGTKPFEQSFFGIARNPNYAPGQNGTISQGTSLKYTMLTPIAINPTNFGTMPLGLNLASSQLLSTAVYTPQLLIVKADDVRKLKQYFSIINPQWKLDTKISKRYNSLTDTYIKGSYDISLQVAFDPIVPAPPPATTTTIKSVVSPKPMVQQNTIRNTGIAVTAAVAITGRWAGIQTNDNGLYPQAVAFELTANNEFIIKDVNGIVASKGTYTYTNNILRAAYKQFSSGETFTMTGSFDSNKQKLVCTLGMGSATTGQGKMEMTKN